MKTDDFDYYLPEELIAQVPLEHREESRLLVMDRDTGKLEDKTSKRMTLWFCFWAIFKACFRKYLPHP